MTTLSPEVVVGLLVLAGVIATALAAVVGALIAGRASRDTGESRERAAFLEVVEANVDGLRRRAVSYEERIDALSERLDRTQQAVADCLEARGILSRKLALVEANLTVETEKATALQARIAELEKRQRSQT